MMTTRGAKLQTRRSKAKQFTAKQQGSSSAGKKRAALTDVTNHVTGKHAAYHKKVLVCEDDWVDMQPVVTDRVDESDAMMISPGSNLTNDVSMKEEPIIDIDMMEDPAVSCSDYTQDIFLYLREAEVRYRPNASYMRKQPDISSNMRSILMEWLVEVADEYKLQAQTLYLGTCYVDRFLSRMSVTRSKLQLLGTAALYLAAKLEEIYPPEVKDFVYITDDTYSKRQVVKMEQVILQCLEFDLVNPTTYTFLVRCLRAVEADETVDQLSHYLCELTLLWDEPFLKYLPSAIATSCVCVALHTVGHNAWPQALAHYSNYNISDIRDCIQDVHTMFCQAATSPRQAIRDKYMTERYHRVSVLTYVSHRITIITILLLSTVLGYQQKAD